MSAAAEAKVAQVREQINQVIDPCSAATGLPLGVMDFGIVDQVEVSEDRVEVVLLPTSPHCLYLGHFDERISDSVQELDWVESVEVKLTDSLEIWDESRIEARARKRLQAHRAKLRRQLDQAVDRAA